MLRFKLCFIDASELHYIPNNLYNKPLPTAQRNALYLATALSARKHQVTFIQEGCLQAAKYSELSIEPFPTATDYWQNQNFDAIILINHLEPGLSLAPYKPSTTALLLWSFNPPKHIGLLPLAEKAAQDHIDLVMFSNAVLAQQFREHYTAPMNAVTYFPVAMTRTLRKRFSNVQCFADMLPKVPTLSFIQRPEQGLEETLNIFETLRQGFEDLRLQVLLPTEERPWSKAEETLIQRCESDDGITVFAPMPQPAYVEQLAKSHMLCSPRAHQENNHYAILDALATGNHCLSLPSETLETLEKKLITWVDASPEETQLVRYTEALAKRLREWVETPEDMIKHSFDHLATVGTYFTWDLRVWEFESLIFQLKKTLPKSPADEAPALK